MLISVSVNYFSLIYLDITASNPAFAYLYSSKTINLYSILGYSIQIITKYTPFAYSVLLISVSVSYFSLIYLGITASKPAFAYLYPGKTINLYRILGYSI